MRSITIDSRSVEAFAMRKLGNYPEGSVSKREVIATIPCDDEQAGWELNGRLTRMIYDYWQRAALEKPARYTKSRDELTELARQLASQAR